MKKFLYIAIIGMVIWSCGGDGDDPPPPPENQAPITPTTIYPANNELCINNAVNFQWNASTDPEGDAITYLVEVSKSNSFSPLEDSKTVSTTSTTITLDKGISFYWRVTAKDSKGLSSDATSSNGFYTEGEGVSNYAPFSPELVAPELDTVVIETDFSPSTDLNAILKWTAKDLDTDDTLTFDVYLDTDINNISIDDDNDIHFPITDSKSTQTTNTFTTGTLTASTTYYWRIFVNDGNGGISKGLIWSFKTD